MSFHSALHHQPAWFGSQLSHLSPGLEQLLTPQPQAPSLDSDLSLHTTPARPAKVPAGDHPYYFVEAHTTALINNKRFISHLLRLHSVLRMIGEAAASHLRVLHDFRHTIDRLGHTGLIILPAN